MPSLLEQMQAFAATVAGGLIMGALFDVLRVLRGVGGRRGPFGWILDLLYWVVLTPLTAVILLEANRGELRLYVLLGLGAGLALYFAFLSGPLLALLLALVRGAAAAAAWVAHLVTWLAAAPAMIWRSLTVALPSGRWRPGRAGWARWSWRTAPWRAGLAWWRR